MSVATMGAIPKIDLIPDDRCTGCTACYHACPVQAIRMEYNEEGFLYPAIDAGKCIDCGKCFAVCPEGDYSKTEKLFHAEGDCYAVMADDETRAASSSGGMFSVVAKHVLSEGGLVCGAAYTPDCMKVEHILIEHEKELGKLRKSKYVQSEMGKVYGEIKAGLEAGRKVLFSGCPCQVAGLYRYLGKDYDSLITLDLICHAANSVYAYQSYLKKIANGREIERVDFRDKEHFGWKSGVAVYFKDGSRYIGESEKAKSLFYTGFLNGITVRKSCLSCHYAKRERVGDITIGDFWRVNEYNKEYSDKKGTSIVLINTEKGEILLEKMKGVMKLCNKVLLDSKYRNLGGSRRSEGRKFFFSHLKRKGFQWAIQYGQIKRYDIGILAKWKEADWSGLLSYYALCCALMDAGLLPIIIKLPEKGSIDSRTQRNEDFLRKFFRISKERPAEEMFQCNHFCDAFLIADDKEDVETGFVRSSKRLLELKEINPLRICDSKHFKELLASFKEEIPEELASLCRMYQGKHDAEEASPHLDEQERNCQAFQELVASFYEERTQPSEVTGKYPYDVGIVGYWWPTNYGSVITYYALYKIVERMGLRPILIDRLDKAAHSDGLDAFSRKFIESHLTTSESMSKFEVHRYNDLCETFLLGSDQVWSPGTIKSYRFFFFLDFAFNSKKKVAYSASFGQHFKVPEADFQKSRKLISRFSGIAVREKDAVKICQESMGVKADWVWDPVFLLNREDYDLIARESKRVEEQPYLLAYILHPSEEKRKILQAVSEQLGLPLRIILNGKAHSFEKNSKLMNMPHILEDVQEEDWLYYFAHASYVVTDSYHGSAMSIIYNKQFLCCTNQAWGMSRFETMLGTLGLMWRVAPSLDEIQQKKLLENGMDYAPVNALLFKEKIRCIQWLMDAIK